MKLDGEKLLDELKNTLRIQSVTIRSAVKVEKYGMANDWIMMKNQTEHLIKLIKSGDYTVEGKENNE